MFQRQCYEIIASVSIKRRTRFQVLLTVLVNIVYYEILNKSDLVDGVSVLIRGGGPHLASRFNQTEGGFCTEVSCFDDVSFPSCDRLLLHKTWAQQHENKGVNWVLPKRCNDLDHARKSKYIVRPYLTRSHNKAVRYISNEAIDMNPKISVGKKHYIKGVVRRTMYG